MPGGMAAFDQMELLLKTFGWRHHAGRGNMMKGCVIAI
jgi:hypothetical protein